MGAQIYATDVWKALYSGRYLSLFSQFPHHSTFTFSPVTDIQARDAHTWLGNLFFIGWYHFFGLFGVQLLRPLLALSSLVLIHYYSNFRRSICTLLLLVLFVYGIHQKLTIRTAIFSVPFSVMLVQLIIADLSGNYRSLYLVPPLLVLWSNLHGSYLVGIGIFILYGTGKLIDLLIESFHSNQNSKNIYTILACLSLSVLGVVFVKPFPHYGLLSRFQSGLQTITSSTQIFQKKQKSPKMESQSEFNFDIGTVTNYAKSLRDLIVPDRPGRAVEFQPPIKRTELLLVWVNFIIFLLFVASLISNGRIHQFRWLLPTIGLFILGLMALRTIGYVSLFGIPVILFLEFPISIPVLSSQTQRMLELFVLCLMLGTISGFISTKSSKRLTGFKEQKIGLGTIPKFSDRVPRYILNNHREEQFFNGYAIGSYLIWKWWPRKKVFQDTKISAYSDRFQKLRIGLDISRLLIYFRLDLSIISKTNQLNRHFFQNNNWRPIKKDQGTIVYGRNSEVN